MIAFKALDFEKTTQSGFYRCEKTRLDRYNRTLINS
jgi:hypothetical protein